MRNGKAYVENNYKGEKKQQHFVLLYILYIENESLHPALKRNVATY